MSSTVQIGVVVLIAATMVLFSLLICVLERRSRMLDSDLAAGSAWLIAANIALLTGAVAVMLIQSLPFWLSTAVIISGAHLGILFGFFAMQRGLGTKPFFAVFSAVSLTTIGLQWGLLTVVPDAWALFVSTSVLNGGLTLIMGSLLWRAATPYGRELGFLVSLPFFVLAAGYALRLGLLSLGAPQTVISTVTALIAFILAYAALQWCFALVALRAARLNMSLDRERQRAENLAQARAQFLAHMSHEIRTPLNSVLGLADVLQTMVRQQDARDILGHIQRSGDLLIHILNDILDVAKLEANAVTIEQRPFRVDGLLRQIQGSHGMTCRDRGLVLLTDTQPEAAGHWLGDAHRVNQILQNVVGNAVKFTETGSVRITASGTDRLHLTVEDTGIGMTPAQVAAMFTEFTQADAGITRRFGGTGLGMAIVHRLVTRMGGTIRVESEIGVGTQFTIALPLPRAEISAEPEPQGVAPTPKDLSSLRVLCADDSKGNLLVLGQMLRLMGIDPQMAQDGQTAIRAAEQQAFDIYLLDISMPGLSGTETLHRLRDIEKDGRRAPAHAVAATANVLATDLAHYTARGFDAHLPKPIRLGALKAVLLGCHHRQSPPDALHQDAAAAMVHATSAHPDK